MPAGKKDERKGTADMVGSPAFPSVSRRQFGVSAAAVVAIPLVVDG